MVGPLTCIALCSPENMTRILHNAAQGPLRWIKKGRPSSKIFSTYLKVAADVSCMNSIEEDGGTAVDVEFLLAKSTHFL